MSESISSTWQRNMAADWRKASSPKPLGPRRKDVIIASKFGQAELLALKDGYPVFSEDKARQGASRRWIMQAVEESLTRLKTDCIDLYQVHVADLETPREETLPRFDDLVRKGEGPRAAARQRPSPPQTT